MTGDYIPCICGKTYSMSHNRMYHVCPHCGHVWDLQPTLPNISRHKKGKPLVGCPLKEKQYV